MLRKLNVDVTTADDGLLAVEAFNQTDFDLILMDIQMPNMDGYRATAEIRKHPNPTKRETSAWIQIKSLPVPGQI